ncbi:MAG TPA: Asp23/Gls24 family envelope stress response protein [Pilimelia sp.]|nr:Asp23/Gls24 family envelope stress response protein [Pilimelia sp.]
MSDTVASDIPGQRREGADLAAESTAIHDPAAEQGVPERAGDQVERAGAVSGRVAADVVDRLRSNAEHGADRGTTTIADEVVEKITGIAVRSVPGVHTPGISVKQDGNRARVNITLVIEYGYAVHSVTTQVRANVIGAIETMLGAQVTEVNIVVDDVHVPEPDASPPA